MSSNLVQPTIGKENEEISLTDLREIIAAQWLYLQRLRGLVFWTEQRNELREQTITLMRWIESVDKEIIHLQKSLKWRVGNLLLRFYQAVKFTSAKKKGFCAINAERERVLSSVQNSSIRALSPKSAKAAYDNRKNVSLEYLKKTLALIESQIEETYSECLQINAELQKFASDLGFGLIQADLERKAFRWKFGIQFILHFIFSLPGGKYQKGFANIDKIHSKFRDWRNQNNIVLPTMYMSRTNNLIDIYNQLELKSNKESLKTQSLDPPSIERRLLDDIPLPSEVGEPTLGKSTHNNWILEILSRSKERKQENLVSIIMPAFNAQDTIAMSIDSVLQQLYKNFELIIVDDGSGDDTPIIVKDYLEQDSRISFLNIDNSGAAKARNLGLAKAKGRFIAYLDSDNYWYPEYLLLSVNFLLENPGKLCIYSAQEIYDRNHFVGIRFKRFQRSLLENKNYIDINSFLHINVLLHEKGGFNSSLKRLEDWELLLRYTENSSPITLPCILGRYYKTDHYLDPKRNPRLPKARKRYTDSLRAIQTTIQRRPLKLKSAKKVIGKDTNKLFANNFLVDKSLSKRVTIIIPNYEALSCLKITIESILEFTPPNSFDLLIIDNASSRKTRSYLSRINKVMDNMILISNPCNMGFTHAVNQGIEASHAITDVVLLNNDTVVTSHWLEALVEARLGLHNAGLIAPRQVLLPQTQTIYEHVPFARKESEVDVTLSTHHKNVLFISDVEPDYVRLKWTTFFCVYISRECISRVGSLSLNSGIHYGSDKEYCERVRELGFDIIYTPHSKVYHLLQQATHELKKKNKHLFETIYNQNSWKVLHERHIKSSL